MTPLDLFYHSLFSQTAQDRLDNYTHVRLLRPASSTNATQLDVVRPIAGPSRRRHGTNLCVLKCIPVPRNDTKAHNRVLRELAIHRAVTLGADPAEDHILPLISHFVTPTIFGTQRQASTVESYAVLVLPYCPRGSLLDFVNARLARGQSLNVLEESELRWTILELAKALQRCHERGIVHRDVKAENILLWEKSSAAATFSLPQEGNGPFRLLLCDFGLSTWSDEREDEANVEGDSTLCGNEDKSGSTVDILALGYLCVFLLTGSAPSTHLEGSGSSSTLSDIRVEEKPKKARLSEVQGRLPPTISQECRNFVEALLNNGEKQRMTIKDILLHPFMISSLPVKPLSNPKTSRFSAPAASARTTIDKSESSSATLRSVMQRVSPAIFLTAEESKMEKRKTPFGVVRLAKQTDADGAQASTTSWGDGYGTRGLISVRQRIKAGKIEIQRDGRVVLQTDDAFLAISGTGLPLTRYLQDESSKAKADDLYRTAARWLRRHRQRCTLAGFMLSVGLQPQSLDKSSTGAADYIAYCSVKGNGPLPDYDVRFAAIEEGTKSKEEWNVQIQVQVQRSQCRLRLLTQLRDRGKRNEASWKESMLSIKSAKRGALCNWILSGTAKTSVIVRELSQREARAVERSLQASHPVDSIFQALIGE